MLTCFKNTASAEQHAIIQASMVKRVVKRVIIFRREQRHHLGQVSDIDRENSTTVSTTGGGARWPHG